MTTTLKLLKILKVVASVHDKATQHLTEHRQRRTEHLKAAKGIYNMVIRKVLLFKTILGFTIPKEFANALNLKHGDYVQIYLGEQKSLIVLKREETFMKINRDSNKPTMQEETNND